MVIFKMQAMAPTFAIITYQTLPNIGRAPVYQLGRARRVGVWETSNLDRKPQNQIGAEKRPV